MTARSEQHHRSTSPGNAAGLDTVLEAMQDVTILVGPGGRCLDIAPNRPDLFSDPSQNLLGCTIGENLPHDQAERFQQAIEQTLQTGTVCTVEYSLPTSGQELWFEGRLSPMRDDEGNITAALLVARDITKHRQAQEALKESEERYRQLVEQSNDAIYLLFENRFEFVNRRFEEMLGASREEVCGPEFSFMRLVAPQSRTSIEDRQRRIGEGEDVPHLYEFTALTKDGRTIEVEASVSYVPYRGGLATQGIVRDITQRKRGEDLLRQRERYLACLADIAEELLRVPDPDILFPEILARLGTTTGVSRAYVFENHRDADGSLQTCLKSEWCAPDLDASADSSAPPGLCLQTAFARWAEELGDNRAIAGDVADFPDSERPFLEARSVQSTLVLPLFVGGSWYGFVGFDVCDQTRRWEEAEIDLLTTAANDIAQALERREAVRAVRESEEKYRQLIELLPDGVAVHQDGIIRMCNRNGATMLGYDSPEDAIGRPVLDFVHPDDRPIVMERVRAQLERGERVPPLEERFLHKDGSALVVEVSAGPFMLDGRPAALVVVHDVTKRKDLEEQLRQAQKMEAVGRLAGGVAHDFSNLLTVIGGYTGLLLHALRPDDPLREEVEAILKATRRGTTLTSQLLAFSRRQVMQMKASNLNQVLKGLEGMLRRVIGEDVELTVTLAQDLWNVRVDPGQMEQVVVNLVVNARDAMPGGGKLTLQTDNVELGAEYAHRHTEVAAGQYVLLSVNDTGVGMTPEIRDHLFEPFFTTREGGTGLGLATVYGIVKQFGGHIEVTSERGLGSTFNVYLRRVTAEAESVAEKQIIEEWPRGNETILVAEDNAMVRALAKRVLRRQGYKVLEARHGEEGLKIAGKHPGPIHLLLTDVIMPQMSGRALAAKMKQSRPEIRVLYMSGYTDTMIVQHGAPEPGAAFIQKPFTPQTLAKKVRDVLDVPTQ